MLFGLESYHIWIIAGLVLFIVEIFTPSFFPASMGLAAWGASVAAALDAAFTTQLAVFAVTALVVFFSLRPFFLRLLHGREPARTGVQALIGREAMVTETIDNRQNVGRIKLAGEYWKAATTTGIVIEPGTRVVVDRIEGATAIVQTTITEH